MLPFSTTYYKYENLQYNVLGAARVGAIIVVLAGEEDVVVGQAGEGLAREA